MTALGLMIIAFVYALVGASHFFKGSWLIGGGAVFVAGLLFFLSFQTI